MREYELIYLLPANTSSDDVEAFNERVSELIRANDGELSNIRTSDVRRLAYEITGHTEGVYVVINFQAPPTVADELNRFLSLEELCPRHMLLCPETR